MLQHRSLLDQHRLTEREEKSFQLLELLRQREPLTRTELSQGTGFNIVTVSNYINEFIKKGLVSERGFDISTGGRKPVLVELNAKTGFAVGIDVGSLHVPQAQMVFVMTDLRGHIVHRVVKTRGMQHMEQILQNLAGEIREFLASSPVETQKIQGIGVGLPGAMDERAGTVRDTSRHGRTHYIAIRDQLESECRFPVLMGNDATLAGLGELRLGLDRPVKNLIYLHSDVGVSLIFNGHIYWGSGGSAGELGIFAPSHEDYLHWIKSPSFVLSNVWDLGLASQAKKLVQEGHATAIRELVHGGGVEAINLQMVVQAAQSGDQLARELVEHAATQFGIRIAYLVNLLNPEVVIIGGGIEHAGSILFEPVCRAVKKYAYEEPASLVDILPAQLGENVVALGAASWVIQEVFIQA